MTMHAHTKPWYAEPWPWLLMAGPAVVIVASAITLWLALVSNDGLVSDDYYKQGLAVNQVLSRDAAARALAYRARVMVSAGVNRATVSMNSEPASAHLVLRAVHPTRPGLDLALPLSARGGGEFETAFPPLAAGRWRIVLEDRERTWRLTGELRLPGATETELTAH
jgi:hypothetical protein